MMMDELKVAIANANSNAVMQLLDQGMYISNLDEEPYKLVY